VRESFGGLKDGEMRKRGAAKHKQKHEFVRSSAVLIPLEKKTQERVNGKREQLSSQNSTPKKKTAQ